MRRELGDEDGVLGAAASAEQLDMLRDGNGKLPGNVFQLVRDQAAKRGAGRPKGAGNRRNDQLAKLIVHQHGDPVMAMASLYSRPLDQLIELVLIADSTAEREERLLSLIDKAEDMIGGVMGFIKSGLADKSAFERATALIDKIEPILERVFDAAKALKMKPGDLAIKALNLQLAAARATAEYVHSKKPVEATVSVKTDGVIVMPAVQPAATFEQKDALVRQAADGIAKMLESGRIDAHQLADYRFVDGQFVDAEFDEVDDGDDAEVQP
jgi:hypothetical protein